MLLQQVLAEIIFEVAPDNVNMIGFVLSIVVLKNERRPLDPKIVWLLRLDKAPLSKTDVIKSCVLHLFQIGSRQLRANLMNETVNQTT